MSQAVAVTKDADSQQPIPHVWRDTISLVVNSFICGNFHLKSLAPEIKPLSDVDASRIERSINGYGDKLAPLSVAVWRTSVCQWMNGYWDAVVDLSTMNEEVSDLALSVRVFEKEDGYMFDIQSVHVP